MRKFLIEQVKEPGITNYLVIEPGVDFIAGASCIHVALGLILACMDETLQEPFVIEYKSIVN